MADNNTKKKNRRNGDYGSKKTENRIKKPDVCAGIFEYKMGKVLADNILKDAKSNRNPQEILCDYVNTQFGLKGYCVKVIVDIV